MILQMDSVNIDKVWEISPYNGTAFGGIVVLLLGAVYYFIKVLSAKDAIIKEKEAQNMELVNKLHSISDVIGEKLTDIKQSHDVHSDKILYVLNEIKKKVDK